MGLRDTVWASSIALEWLYAKLPGVRVVISGTKSARSKDMLRISANVTGDFGNVTDLGLGAGLRG